MNTNARRVIRTGGHVTGVELECQGGSGHSGVVNVTAGTGRVIVSAGTMGSAKVLFRSEFLNPGGGSVLTMYRWHWTDRCFERGQEFLERWRHDDLL